jgi:hypothetical protein
VISLWTNCGEYRLWTMGYAQTYRESGARADPKGVAVTIAHVDFDAWRGGHGREMDERERVLGRSRSVTPTAMVVATEPECKQAPNPISLARRSASAAD